MDHKMAQEIEKARQQEFADWRKDHNVSDEEWELAEAHLKELTDGWIRTVMEGVTVGQGKSRNQEKKAVTRKVHSRTSQVRKQASKGN